jgi:hypothetical protein
MKRKPSKLLVIDASVARAAGETKTNRLLEELRRDLEAKREAEAASATSSNGDVDAPNTE